jgi:alpha-maltose-1-phosphate synthase
MRIAYLSTDPGIAYGGTKGASVHMAELVAALAAAGVDVLLVVASCAPDAAPPDGVTLEVLPGPGKHAPASARLAAQPERAAWLEARLGSFGADVVYERVALHSAIGFAASRAVGIPHVIELNAPLLVEAKRYRRLDFPAEADRLERTVLENADLVLAVSRPLASYATERGALHTEVLPNAVALERYPAARANATDRAVAVFAGSLRPWHGVDTMVEAWSLLGDDAPELLVVGDGTGRRLLEAAGARVTGTVPHSEVPALLAGAHIGLVPYDRDAPDYFSPLKLFEYLAAGLATVAADLPCVRDVVTAESAVLVSRGDGRALAGAVAALAEDPERRERIGRAGRALVAAQHTWAHRARRILELVRELAPAEVPA